MKRVLLAIYHRGTEDKLKNSLSDQFQFVGTVVSKESVLENVRKLQPDILLLREGISGSMDMNDLLVQLRNEHENVRIIFLANKRKQGDPFLSSLVSLSIYDILYGGKVRMSDLERLMKVPNKRKEVAHLQVLEVSHSTGNKGGTSNKIREILISDADRKLLENRGKEEKKNTELPLSESSDEADSKASTQDAPSELSVTTPIQPPKKLKKEKEPKEKKPKKDRSRLKTGLTSVAIILALSVGLFFIYNALMDGAIGGSSDKTLVEALRLASSKDYTAASELFDELEYEKLNDEDKDVMLLAYLFSDQPIKALQLEPNFIDSVINYYHAKEQNDMIYDLAEKWEDPALDFEIAIMNQDYEEIIALKDEVKLKDNRQEAVVLSYLHLDDLDGAKSFVIDLDRAELFEIIEEYEEEKEKLEKEEAEKKRKELEEEAEKNLKEKEEENEETEKKSDKVA